MREAQRKAGIQSARGAAAAKNVNAELHMSFGLVVWRVVGVDMAARCRKTRQHRLKSGLIGPNEEDEEEDIKQDLGNVLGVLL
jgi:hypothetical protein